jgi:23S rRNA (pseudouridine1915-N3)-methyltransferase
LEVAASFLVLTVGKPREGHVQALVDGYRKRTPPPYLWEWETVPAAPLKAGEVGRTLLAEAEALERRFKPGDRLVVLDPHGEQDDSPRFAARLEHWLADSRRTVFIIGGGPGLDPALKARADWMWSLTPLTLPHELALLVAAEQIYRAWSISYGHPYHK